MLGWFSRLIPEESIIEGIGNELLFVVGFIGFCVFVVLAWISTRVNQDLLSIRFTLVPQPNSGATHETDPQNQPVETSADGATVSQLVNDGGATSIPTDESSLDELQDERIDIDSTFSGEHEGSCTQKASLLRMKSGTPEEQKAYASYFRPRGHIVLRLQYINDRTRYVHAPPEMLISQFKRKHFADELTEPSKNVRLIFQGHELVEQRGASSHRTNFSHSTTAANSRQLRLCDYNVRDGSTIHCLVTTSVASVSRDMPPHIGSRSHESASGDSLLTEFDMGARLLEPLFAFLLAFTWFFRIAYRQYFNSVSTFALITLSVFFCGAVFTMNFMNAASAVSAFTARRRNRRNTRITSTIAAMNTDSSESGGDIGIQALTATDLQHSNSL